MTYTVKVEIRGIDSERNAQMIATDLRRDWRPWKSDDDIVIEIFEERGPIIETLARAQRTEKS